MKKFKFNLDSLKKQLLAGVFLGIIVLIVLLEISQYYSLKNNLYLSKTQLLESRLHNIDIAKLKNTDNQEALSKNAESLVNSMIDLDVGISIIDINGSLVTDSEGKARSSYIKGLLPGEAENNNMQGPLPQLSSDLYKALIKKEGILEENRIVSNSSGEKYMILISKLGNIDNSTGLIQLSTSLASVDNIIKQQLIWYAAIALCAFILMALILAKFISFSLDPLNKITSAIGDINDNKLNTRVKMDVNQIEIKRLIAEFNGMLERIENSFENEKAIADKMKKFVSDASHELRTPLTSIQGFSQLLSDGDITSEADIKTSLNTITNESRRLTRLLNNLLLLTKLDYQVDTEKKPENIKKILEDITGQLKLIAGSRELHIYSEDVWINTNPDQIKQIIINLINNAAEHTDEQSGKINIEIKNVSIDQVKYGTIIISDNGTGIPKDQLSMIFHRFYRVEPHRSRKYGGFGLGLSIIKSIVDENDGKIQVESEINNGSIFKVYFKALDFSKEPLS